MRLSIKHNAIYTVYNLYINVLDPNSQQENHNTKIYNKK